MDDQTVIIITVIIAITVVVVFLIAIFLVRSLQQADQQAAARIT